MTSCTLLPSCDSLTKKVRAKEGFESSRRFVELLNWAARKLGYTQLGTQHQGPSLTIPKNTAKFKRPASCSRHKPVLRPVFKRADRGNRTTSARPSSWWCPIQLPDKRYQAWPGRRQKSHLPLRDHFNHLAVCIPQSKGCSGPVV